MQFSPEDLEPEERKRRLDLVKAEVQASGLHRFLSGFSRTGIFLVIALALASVGFVPAPFLEFLQGRTGWDDGELKSLFEKLCTILFALVFVSVLTGQVLTARAAKRHGLLVADVIGRGSGPGSDGGGPF